MNRLQIFDPLKFPFNNYVDQVPQYVTQLAYILYKYMYKHNYLKKNILEDNNVLIKDH